MIIKDFGPKISIPLHVIVHALGFVGSHAGIFQVTTDPSSGNDE
jgi:hypothetical protein